MRSYIIGCFICYISLFGAIQIDAQGVIYRPSKSTKTNSQQTKSSTRSKRSTRNANQDEYAVVVGCEEISIPDTILTHGYVNGHEWVDLGLPSGTKWATCNVGALTPEGRGTYFSWGETNKKDEYIFN